MAVVVLDENGEHHLQLVAVEDQHPVEDAERSCIDDEKVVEALGSDGPNEPLRVGVRVRRPEWGSQDLGAEREGLRVIRTSVRAPQANAYAERWVGTLRRECLDWIPIFGRRHLEAVLQVYAADYNGHRPHRGLDQRAPLAAAGRPPIGQYPIPSNVRRRDRIGGLLHEYSRAA